MFYNIFFEPLPDLLVVPDLVTMRTNREKPPKSFDLSQGLLEFFHPIRKG
jgi:hypothetical protein